MSANRKRFTAELGERVASIIEGLQSGKYEGSKSVAFGVLGTDGGWWEVKITPPRVRQ